MRRAATPAFALLVPVLLLAAGCGGGGQTQSSPEVSGEPTRGPSPTLLAVTPHVESSLAALSRPELLVRDFSPELDSISLIDPTDATKSKTLASVQHPVNLGIEASVAPDSKTVAYNALPLGTQNTAAANLWLFDLTTGQTRMLAEGMELAANPVWSPAGDFLIDRMFFSGFDQIVRVDVSNGLITPLASGEGFADIVEIGVSPAGAVYYVTRGTSGDDLVSVAATGGQPTTMHLSDTPTRNWMLSPGSSHLVFLNQDSTASAARLSAMVVNLATGERRPLLLEGGDDAAPIWTPDGRAVTLGKRDSKTGEAISVNIATGEVMHHAIPGTPFDAPVTWSPDGAYLVVQNFGTQVPSIDLLSADGQRTGLGPNTYFGVIGWVKP